MKHWTFAVLLLLLSVGTAGAFETDHPAPDRSSYDPMALGKRAEQPKGIIETTLEGINPRNRNYGEVVADWRQDAFGNTLRQAYFWSLIGLGMGLGISLAGNGWLLRERERRLTISADVVTQLFNAYTGSRAKALEVIGKYNALIDRYNRIDGELCTLKASIAAEAAPNSDAVSEFEQAKSDKPGEPPCANETDEHVPEQESADGYAALSGKVTELETRLRRREAQLQAKDNQITNLRGRLARAHDSLEGERKQRA